MDRWNLPRGWAWISVGDVASTVGGYGFPIRFQGNKDLPYPFIKVSDMNLPGNETYIYKAENTIDNEILDEIGAHTSPEDTIIFPKVGGAIATNKKRILGLPGVFDNNIMGLSLNEDRVNVMYCYLYLQAIDLMDLAKHGPVPSIRQSVVESYPLPIPYPNQPEKSLAEQERIVSRIEALFAELAEMQTLQEKIAGDTGQLMDAVLADVFSMRAREAWPHRIGLSNIAEITASQVDPTLPEYRNLPHIYGKTIEEGTGKLLAYNTAAEDGMTSGKYHFQPGAVLYSKIRPYLRKVTIVEFTGLCSADMYPLRLKTDDVTKEFLMWTLLSPDFTDYANQLSGRARIPKINRTQLFGYQMRYPDISEQERISDYLFQVRTELSLLHKINASDAIHLEQLEQAILAQAFRGEL